MPHISVTRDRNIVTVSDGRHVRQTLCASPRAAESLEARLRNDASTAVRWARNPVAMHLDMSLEPAHDEPD